MFTFKQFNNMKELPVPEILKTSLTSVVMQLLAVGVKDVRHFDYLDRPSKESLDAAINGKRL